MDNLDMLKKDWKTQDQNLPQLSYDQIYQMLWKRSSSIVRWIFVISILELFLSTLLSFFMIDDTYWENMRLLNLTVFTIVSFVLSYLIAFTFIFLFYRNYKRISVTDDAITLMRNILRTRRTVKTYIAYVLISTFLTSVFILYMSLRNTDYMRVTEGVDPANLGTAEWVGIIAATTVILGAFLGLLWLFYRLIYGILLKKLQRNYKQLKKLEL